MTVVMAVQPSDRGALPALNSVLQSIESVRNYPALYLLLLSFAASGLLVSAAQGAMARSATLPSVLALAAACFALFYGSNAAGLLLMDEATGAPPRSPAEALRDALRIGHRLLLVVGAVLVAVALLVAAVVGLLLLTRVPALGPSLLAVVVPVAVPALGLAVVAMVMLVGPLAAPAVWSGLRPRAVLAMLRRQARERFAHAVLLAAAVSLLSAAVAALVSFTVLAGGRVLLGLALLVADVDLAPQPFFAALFGIGWRLAPGAPALSAPTTAALSGAGVVFALGLVLPAAVYLRGLCELFLALRSVDQPPALSAAAVPPLPAPLLPP
jgi:hypothetical protein